MILKLFSTPIINSRARGDSWKPPGPEWPKFTLLVIAGQSLFPWPLNEYKSYRHIGPIPTKSLFNEALVEVSLLTWGQVSSDVISSSTPFFITLGHVSDRKIIVGLRKSPALIE